MRAPYRAHRDDDDFVQPRALIDSVLSPADTDHLVNNIVSHLRQDVSPAVTTRVIEYWRDIHTDIGARVAKQLN